MAKILIVEDENIVARDIAGSLQALGYTVCDIAATGEEAIKKAQRHSPDLILMDIKLEGEMTGIEAANAIVHHVHVPIIYLTAHADNATLHKARHTHPSGYLLKPFKEHELRITIEMALYKAQMEKKLRESERQLNVTLQSIGDAVISTDAEHRVVFMNGKAKQLTNQPEEKIQGFKFDEVFVVINESTGDPIDIFPALSANPGRMSWGEALLVSYSGSMIPIEYRVSLLHENNAMTDGIVVVFRDVSQERTDRRKMASLARFAEENPHPVLRVDTEGILLYTNPASRQLFSRPDKDIDIPAYLFEYAAQAAGIQQKITVEEAVGDRLLTFTFVPAGKNDEDKYVNIYGCDITEHRQVDKALKESHRRFRELLEKVPLISLILDIDGNITFCNEYLQNLLDLPREEIIGRNWFDTFLPDGERQYVKESYLRRIDKDIVRPYFDNYITAGNGESRLISWTNTLLRNSEGQAVGIASLGIDITERKKETQALQESEERYRKLVDLSPLGIIIHTGGLIVFCNPTGAKMLGAKSPQEILGLPIISVVAPEYRNIAEERINSVYEYHTAVGAMEEQLVRLDGTMFDAEVSALPTVHNHKPAVQVVFTDISDRKQAQEQIVQQLLRLQALYDLHYHAGHSQTIEQIYNAGLRALERTLSITRSALLLCDSNGDLKFRLWHNLSAEYRQALESFAPWKQNGRMRSTVFIPDVSTEQFAPELHHYLEQEQIGSLAIIPITLDQQIIGKLTVYFNTRHDFTHEEKLLIESIASHIEFALTGITAEKRLRESEEKFRMLSEKTATVIAIFKETYLYVNPAFERLTGYSSAEAASMPYIELFDPESRNCIGNSIDNIIQQQEPFRCECRIRTRSGVERWLDIIVDSLPYKGEEAAFFSGTDITERKQNELLIQAQKEILEMIAHGTPLTAIFECIASFIEKQSPGTICVIYTPETDGTYIPHCTVNNSLLPDCVAAGDISFIARALQEQVHQIDCVAADPHDQTSIRSVCAFPALDSRKNIAGIVVVINNGYNGFEQHVIQMIQISAQLVSIALERDFTFEALEQALQKNFRRVVQNLQTHVFKLERRDDNEFYYTLSEGRLAEMAGIVTDRVAGIPISRLIGQPGYDKILPRLGQAFAGEALSFEEQIDSRWFLTTYEPIFDDNGPVTEVIGSTMEITRQKLVEGDLRASEERYKLIVDTLPIGIMKMTETEEGWNYEYANAQAAMQTGYTKEEFSDEQYQGDAMAIHPDDQALLNEQWQEWLLHPNKKNIHMTYRYRHKQGHYIWLDNYAIKITNPHTRFQEIIQMVMDITEQKKAEHELHTALAKERELNNLKTRFVSTVSHEFRTPLTGILMSTEILERYIDRLDPEQRMEEINKIKVRVNELTELMDDFLLQSSLQSMAERFRPTDVDLAELCRHCFTEFQSILSENSHTLISTIPDSLPSIHGDPRLLRHLIQNLLSNAIKYSASNSTVHFIIRQEGHQIVIEVRDTGIGIPAEDIPRLFTPFFRASNTGKIKGTGLGLSIIKEFVEIHGGSITVSSVVDKGTTFTVYLPLAYNWAGRQVLHGSEYINSVD